MLMMMMTMMLSKAWHNLMLWTEVVVEPPVARAILKRQQQRRSKVTPCGSMIQTGCLSCSLLRPSLRLISLLLQGHKRVHTVSVVGDVQDASSD